MEARMKRGTSLAALVAFLVITGTAAAQRPAATSSPLPTIAARTAGLERQDGFFPFHIEAATGRILLEVSRLGEDFLYLNSLATGIGSNALGLDRGTIGAEAVVRFERHGQRLLMIQRNTGYRAQTEDQDLIRSVEESFAVSVLGSFPIVAQDGNRLLIDATDFFLQDAFDLRARIRRSNQGDFRLDRDRSVLWLPRTKAFPKNTEVEVLLTFASENPGMEIRRHTPDGRSLSLRQHHSFVELPPPGYEPRAFDPRVGLFALNFMDFARPFDEGYDVRWINRWRLEKKDPSAAMSEPVRPIIYYLDRGIPEPYRTAFREGALWWNKVFEAAGYINAFRVEDLPEGADPMDARYSVVQWIHRSEPGFAIGPSFRDPRTGEIIKAAVRMDSHRSLTNFNVFAGTNPALAIGEAPLGQGAFSEMPFGEEPFGWGATCMLDDPAPGEWIAALDPRVDAESFVMARRRQHTAHEIGHTLGLSHNFIAEADGRSSVMDYPAPLIRLGANGQIDLSEAYRNGPGAYDTLAIRYAYTEFASPEAETRGLEAIVRDGITQGLRFMPDAEAGEAGMMPEATRWLHGNDAVAEVERTMKVRQALLTRFGSTAIRTGEPVWLLAERLTPVYLHHRYAVEAAIKTIGGMEYTFALQGDGQVPARVLEPARQRAALDRLIATIQPETLAIPEEIAGMIPPRPFGYRGGSWILPSAAGAAFDPIAAARSFATFVVDGVLQHERAARVVAFHARNAASPSLDEILGKMVDGTWGTKPPATAGAAALRRVSQRAVLDGLIALAANSRATADVRAAAEWQLREIASHLVGKSNGDLAEQAHRALAAGDIERFLERRDTPTTPPPAPATPPGTPIGGAAGVGF
jgi:hypothetical protein